MSELLAECIFTFGAGLGVGVLPGMPSSYELIVVHKDRSGWLGPAALLVAGGFCAIGVFLMKGAA